MSRLKDLFNNFMGAMAEAMGDARHTSTYGPRVYTERNQGRSHGIVWRPVARQEMKDRRGRRYYIIIRHAQAIGKTYRDPGYAINRHIREQANAKA